eukprot:gene8633-10245_t
MTKKKPQKKRKKSKQAKAEEKKRREWYLREVGKKRLAEPAQWKRIVTFLDQTFSSELRHDGLILRLLALHKGWLPLPCALTMPGLKHWCKDTTVIRCLQSPHVAERFELMLLEVEDEAGDGSDGGKTAGERGLVLVRKRAFGRAYDSLASRCPLADNPDWAKEATLSQLQVLHQAYSLPEEIVRKALKSLKKSDLIEVILSASLETLLRQEDVPFMDPVMADALRPLNLSLEDLDALLYDYELADDHERADDHELVDEDKRNTLLDLLAELGYDAVRHRFDEVGLMDKWPWPEEVEDPDATHSGDEDDVILVSRGAVDDEHWNHVEVPEVSWRPQTSFWRLEPEVRRDALRRELTGIPQRTLRHLIRTQYMVELEQVAKRDRQLLSESLQHVMCALGPSRKKGQPRIPGMGGQANPFAVAAVRNAVAQRAESTPEEHTGDSPPARPKHHLPVYQYDGRVVVARTVAQVDKFCKE